MSNQPSAGSSSGSSYPPPPAPPLPPPRASSRMTNALSRIFPWGNTSRIPEGQAGDQITSNTTRGTIPSSSQNASYKTELEMTSLARSPDGKYAVLAGEKIFRTIKIESTKITEKDDLRAAITSHASTHSDISSASLQQLDIKDVQWSHSELSSTIITASANGRITLYDINRIGASLEVSRIQGHQRQIHKISVNPHKGNWMLSASQDGTIKLFDLRVHSTGQGTSTFNATSMYKCNADAVRDVKWSPRDGMEFACATDSGVVQKWDMRQTMSPLLKLNAHSKACRSISWHPDGNNLISGGLDQLCHVWDVSKSSDRRQKPKHTIQTPAPVSIVSWRPPKWTSTFEKWRAAQVAVVYDDTNPAEMQESTVQIWDIARPGMPFKEVFDFDTSPTSLIWQGSDLIWTVGKYGAFTQTDIAFASKTIDNRSLASMSISSAGEILVAMDKRILITRQRPVPPTSISGPEAGASSGSNTESHASSISGAHAGTFRADADDDLVGNFLNIRPRRRRRRAGTDHQSSGIHSSGQGSPTLEESLAITGEFVNKQLLAFHKIPGTADKGIWDFLSNVYLGCVYEEKKDAQKTEPEFVETWPWYRRFEHIIETYAIACERLQWYRTAQSWRIVGHSLGTTLVRRAEFHRDQRVSHHKEIQEQREKQQKQAAKLERETKAAETEMLGKVQNQELHTPAKSIMSEEIESTSNVATPLARPTQEHSTFIDADLIELSPPIPSPIESSTEGYDFYDTASLVPAINIITPQRRLPLRLNYPPLGESSTAQTLYRHDSTESFEMFSTSEDSQKGKFDSSSDNDEKNNKDSTPRTGQSISQEVESSWDSTSGFGQGNGDGTDTASPPLLVVQKASLQNAEYALPQSDQGVYSKEPGFPTAVDPSKIVDSDYLPVPDDPLFIIAPLAPELNISRWLEYESTKSVLTPAAIVLFLRPLLQPGTIDDGQARQILLHFHQRLNAMELFTSATLLRKVCNPEYPAIYEQGRWGKEIGFKCSKCDTAMKPDANNPSPMTFCNKCRASMDGCSLCQQFELPDTIDGYKNERYPDDPEKLIFDPKAPGAGFWVWCQGCEHGGHAACLSSWHALNGELYSGGQCPVFGCGHACIPGKYQDELNAEADARVKAELERQVRDNTNRYSGNTRSIRRDSEEVAASNAVESVRGALGNL